MRQDVRKFSNDCLVSFINYLNGYSTKFSLTFILSSHLKAQIMRLYSKFILILVFGVAKRFDSGG